MKNKKMFTMLALILPLVALASCDPNGGGGGNTDDAKTYIFEAESQNLDDYYGTGDSGGGAQDGAIQNGIDFSAAARDSLNKKDSDGNDYNGGFIVGYFNGEGTTLKFVFEAEADVTGCSLSFRLGSEHGNMMFNPDILAIKVNGVELDYDTFTVTGGEPRAYDTAFKDYAISTKIDLVANTILGDNDIKDEAGNVVYARKLRQQNIITLTINNNEYWSGGTHTKIGGPGIDCMKITSTVKLSAEDYWVGGFPIDCETVDGKAELIYARGYKEDRE